MHARFALLIPLLIALPVNAGTPDRIKVSHADLNLVSVKGRATFERRIESAVEQVCSYGSNPELAFRAATQKCQTAARAAARSQMQVAIERAASANEIAAAVSSPTS